MKTSPRTIWFRDRLRRLFTLTALLPVVMTWTACSSQTPHVASSTPNWVRLGSVEVDTVGRCVLATGFVKQVEGVVELLACGPGGKTHESVFVLQASPVDFQAALLSLRLKPGGPMQDRGMGPPAGAPVDIRIEWTEAGKTRSVAAHDVLYDHRDGKPMTTAWAFNGSMMKEGRFMALEEESFIATYWDPWAVINFAGPLGEDDEALFIKRGVLPPLDTPVRLLVYAR